MALFWKNNFNLFLMTMMMMMSMMASQANAALMFTITSTYDNIFTGKWGFCYKDGSEDFCNEVDYFYTYMDPLVVKTKTTTLSYYSKTNQMYVQKEGGPKWGPYTSGWNNCNFGWYSDDQDQHDFTEKYWDAFLKKSRVYCDALSQTIVHKGCSKNVRFGYGKALTKPYPHCWAKGIYD